MAQLESTGTSWRAWFFRMPPCGWFVQTNHRFMLGSLAAHGIVYFSSAISSILNSQDNEPPEVYIAYLFLTFASLAGAVGAQLLKERPQCYECWTILSWCIMQPIACYCPLFSTSAMARVRAIAVNFILWKTWPTIVCRTKVSIPYLGFCLCNDVIVSSIARNWHSQEFDEDFPLRSYVFGVSVTIAYICIAVFQNHRMHSLSAALAELAAEKDAFQALMTMVCDATVWISGDSKMVLRCDKRFDMMMGKSMQGVPLEEVVVNPEEEVARLHRVFARDTGGGGYTQPPVVLLPTTLHTATGPATTDLFIVRNQVAQQKYIDRPCANGFLVGVRLSHEQAGVPSAPPPNTMCETVCYAQEEAMGGRTIRSIARSDGDASAPMYSCPSCTAQSAPAVLVGLDQEALVSRPFLCQEGGDCLPAAAVAWIDKHPAPKPLHRLSAGERILCYDNVGARLTYADILKVAPAGKKENSNWVKLTLADGGELSMTADHPVAVQSSQTKQQLARTCLQAGDVQANSDKVLVLKMTPTLVTNVEHISKAALDAFDSRGSPESLSRDSVGNHGLSDWITIEVDQPQRHEMLVAPCDRYGMPGEMVAVSSCDRLPDPTARGLCEKNTFFEIPENDDSSTSRAHSAPPSVFRGRPWHQIEANQIEAKTNSESSKMSALSDSVESMEHDTRAKILTGYGGGDPQEGGAKVSRLTDLIYWKRSGLPSLGSEHKHTECRPCSFHYTWQRMPEKRPPCKMGYLCDYCHDDSHHDGWRSKYRKRRRPKETPPLKIGL